MAMLDERQRREVKKPTIYIAGFHHQSDSYRSSIRFTNSMA